MKTHSLRFSVLPGALALSTVLTVGIFYADLAEAAQGCGRGFHRNFYGRCVYNHPGLWARPVYGHPRCWRNVWGHVRCYR